MQANSTQGPDQKQRAIHDAHHRQGAKQVYYYYAIIIIISHTRESRTTTPVYFLPLPFDILELRRGHVTHSRFLTQ